MRGTAIAIVLACFATPARADDDRCKDGALLPEVRVEQSGAGELWIIDRPRPLWAHFRIAVAAGLEDEPAEQPGVASVAARALIAEARSVSRIDPRFSIEVGDRSSAISGSAPVEEIAPAMVAVLEALRRAAWDDKAIARAVAEARNAAQGSEDALVLERAVRRAAIAAGARRPPAAPAIDPAAVRGWLERARRRVIAAVIGPLEDDQLAAIKHALDGFRGGALRAPVAPAAAVRRPGVLVDRPGRGRARIALVRRIPAELAAHSEVLRVLAEALSGGAGRIGRLVGPLGAAAEIEVSLGPSRYPDLMTIGFEAQSDRVAQAIGEVLEALGELRREPWSETETRRARSRAIGSLRLALAEPAGVAAAITDSRIGDRPLEELEASLGRLVQVDHLAVGRAATEVLDEGTWQVVVVGEASPGLIAGLGGITSELEVWSGETLWGTPGARADR